MSQPTNSPTNPDSSDPAAEDWVTSHHAGAPTPPGDAHRDSAQDDEDSTKFHHPGAPTPPDDATEESAADDSVGDAAAEEAARSHHPGAPTPPPDDVPVQHSHPGAPVPPGDASH